MENTYKTILELFGLGSYLLLGALAVNRLYQSYKAEKIGLSNTITYHSQEELDRDLPGRIERFGLNRFDITARLEEIEPSQRNLFARADIHIGEDGKHVKIRLSPTRGNYRFGLDHELAHLCQFEQGSKVTPKGLFNFIKFTLIYDPEANFYAAGLKQPKKDIK